MSASTSAAPFFLYYALGNLHEPLQVPLEEMVKHKTLLSSIPNDERRVYATMTILGEGLVLGVISVRGWCEG